ncbi:hypothetical protein B0T10DRAFT_558970 [Thelonectria olida]|uniref:Transmembrane protein n=1 Tax=Thelonectria olida TaxID=1576542 RepID=A0A9P8W7B8_9HYPO|nr:hypothetical protein B0T10DRAFT_558970 [Thelonectria olida]
MDFHNPHLLAGKHQRAIPHRAKTPPPLKEATLCYQALIFSPCLVLNPLSEFTMAPFRFPDSMLPEAMKLLQLRDEADGDAPAADPDGGKKTPVAVIVILTIAGVAFVGGTAFMALQRNGYCLSRNRSSSKHNNTGSSSSSHRSTSRRNDHHRSSRGGRGGASDGIELQETPFQRNMRLAVERQLRENPASASYVAEDPRPDHSRNARQARQERIVHSSSRPVNALGISTENRSSGKHPQRSLSCQPSQSSQLTMPSLPRPTKAHDPKSYLHRVQAAQPSSSQDQLVEHHPEPESPVRRVRSARDRLREQYCGKKVRRFSLD